MITVFTPTYNRASLISRLYNSLLEQTLKDFEWVVVDDGSTDNTEQIFKDILAKENPFKIKYIKQENGGKHRAINKGVQEASGELFFIVDSDDYLVNNAIEKIISWEKTLDDSRKWAGISGLRGYNSKSVIGKKLGEDITYIDAKNNQRRRLNLTGDKAEAYYTDILKKYPFPGYSGEKFLSEETVWNEIAIEGYYIRWFNEIIYICDYLEGGLTKSGDDKYIKNPQGVLAWAKTQLKAYPFDLQMKVAVVERCKIATRDKLANKELAKTIGINSLSFYVYLFLLKIKKIIKRILR